MTQEIYETGTQHKSPTNDFPIRITKRLIARIEDGKATYLAEDFIIKTKI